MSTKQERMMSNIKAHGHKLITAFGLPADTDPITLCKRLRRIETKLHRLTEDWCNGDIDESYYTTRGIHYINQARALLNYSTSVIFLNGDPRGYALKTTEDFADKHNLPCDWGGYGILAPDLTEN